VKTPTSLRSPWCVRNILSLVCTLSDDCQACAEHRLDAVNIKTKPGSSVSVVLASQGYPGSYPKGKEITIGSVPPSELARQLNLHRFMESLQTSSFSTLERPDPMIKSSRLVDESLQSQHMPKPFRRPWTLHISQLKTSNSTVKRTVEILHIGYFGVGRCGFPLLTCHA